MSTLSWPLSYQRVSLAAALVCTVLAVILMVYPALLLWLFGIGANAASDFVSRREAILFLGLATIALLGRNAPDSVMRRAVSSGLCVIMVGLVCLGVFELLRGVAGPGILLAVAAEGLFALLYMPFARSARVPAAGA